MQQYIGFYLNQNEYTVPILKVQEIIKLPLITKIPQTPYYIEGVTNLRGNVIPILNLKSLINLSSEASKGNKVIVVTSGKKVFGVLVDDISGVINIDESTIESCDDFFEGNVEQVEGVARLSDRLVVLLNTKKLIPHGDIGIFDDVGDIEDIEDIEDIQTSDDGSKVEVTKTVHSMAGEIKMKEVHDAKDFFEKSGISTQDPRYMMLDDIVGFMEAISNKDYEKADIAVQDILKKGQNNLFKEVGKVTRKLHDSILSFRESLDPRLKDITEHEMPTVVERLNFVIDKTKEAADNTMSVAEKYLLAIDELSSHIRKVQGPDETINYLKDFKNNLEDDLIKIITAQSFQDLTGQTIKKVIILVSEVEGELVKVIKTFGIKVDSGKEHEAAADKVSQSEVDDLLKNLGF